MLAAVLAHVAPRPCRIAGRAARNASKLAPSRLQRRIVERAVNVAVGRAVNVFLSVFSLLRLVKKAGMVDTIRCCTADANGVVACPSGNATRMRRATARVAACPSGNATRMRRATALAIFALAGTAQSVVITKGTPITGPWPSAYPAKEHCSNCGLCASSVGVRHVKEACAFLGEGMSRAEALEPSVHGRGRQYDGSDLSEAHFGVHERIVLARGNLQGAQWTGVATGVALAMLDAGEVDAVVVAASADESSGFGAPKPLLCRTADEVLRGRRVKPSLCPSLSILDEVEADASIRRLSM